jgi:hypothetical protein
LLEFIEIVSEKGLVVAVFILIEDSLQTGVGTGLTQDWFSAGFPIDTPQLLESVQVRVCVEFEHVFQSVQSQFGVQMTTHDFASLGLPVVTPQLFKSEHVLVC